MDQFTRENRYAQKFDLYRNSQNFQTLLVKSHLKNPFANNSLMGYMESPEV